MIGTALVGVLPATFRNNEPSKLGFAQVPEHTRIRITSPRYQSSTNYRYISWCYDMLTDLTTNKHNTQMVLNKGLTTSKESSLGLNHCGGNKSSPLLNSIDSKQMIKS